MSIYYGYEHIHTHASLAGSLKKLGSSMTSDISCEPNSEIVAVLKSQVTIDMDHDEAILFIRHNPSEY